MYGIILAAAAAAVCILGADGNYYTNENPFVDPENHDFRLKPGACGINIGAVIPGVTDQPDFLGNKRDGKPDIGAIEYIQVGQQPPENLRVIP